MPWSCTPGLKNWRRPTLIKIVTVCGSPVPGSSTELLLKRIGDSLVGELGLKCHRTFVYLNELNITPCQACGEDPTPTGCFIDDEMTALYPKLLTCDCLIFGTPIYFDSMSAQSKLFIDRCNCLRPANFTNPNAGDGFVRRIHHHRPGAIVLVGGNKAWFEGARRPIAGYFKWLGVSNEATLIFSNNDINNRIGTVVDHPKVLAEADRIGQMLARKIRE